MMSRVTPAALTPSELSVHGNRISYRSGGRGPALLLLHGITNSSETWERVAAPLAERFTLIAPDLLGHGQSATPRGDYSLGAHASGARDLLTALGIERVTVVGHSLGGGIAMQFAYQFPERCERLVLVSSGGLGREVHLLLRAAALPGADYVLPALTSAGLVGVGRGVGGLLRLLRVTPGEDLEVLARGFASLDNAGSRQAFLHTVRSVIEPGGQRVSAQDRLTLVALLPTLIVWGERDSIIPVEHGAAAHEAMPGSRFEVFPDAGHMPHDADPERFAALLTEFCEATDAARLDARITGARSDGRGDGHVSAERLSALDASFLAVERPDAPMHVGWVATFDAPEQGPRPAFDELVEHIAGRLGRAPRYRQRLAARAARDARSGVGRRRRLRRERAPAAGGWRATSARWSTPCSPPRCERDRPLWEISIADEPARRAARARRQDAPLHGRRGGRGGARQPAARRGARRLGATRAPSPRGLRRRLPRPASGSPAPRSSAPATPPRWRWRRRAWPRPRAASAACRGARAHARADGAAAGAGLAAEPARVGPPPPRARHPQPATRSARSGGASA